jgi:hypothetical protein
MLLSSFCFWTRYVFGVLKLFLFRAKCSLTINNNKTQMGRTWVCDASTMFKKNPQLSRPSSYITLLTFISLRRSVRQLGSSFANFIKLYGSRFLFCCQIRFLQFTNFPKRKGHQVLAWVCGFHFL